jgi:hypothetical protein
VSEELKGQLKRRYAEAALAVQGTDHDEPACCEPSCCGGSSQAQKVDFTGGSYSEEELGELPEQATQAVQEVPLASAFIRARKPQQ